MASERMNDTLEIIDLESLMSDELQCQSNHGVDDDDDYGPYIGYICSHKVVARKRCDCGDIDILVCHNSYVWNIYVINDGWSECESCGRPIPECWSINLI